MTKWALIVASYSRSTEVKRLLDSLLDQEEKAFRVILVDQNLDGRLDPIVLTYCDRMCIDHVHIPPRGVSQARNVGLAMLRDEPFVAFPDDDCYYEATTLSNAELALRSTPTVTSIIGSSHPLGDSKKSGIVPTSLNTLGRFRTLVASPTYALFFTRSAVDNANGFDETLGPGAGTPWLCGEDADYLLRAGGLTGLAARAPGVRVFHPRGDAPSTGFKSKAFGYGRGRMRVLRKHNYPWWFKFANVLHPLSTCLVASANTRKFRWHLFRGRLHEWRHPHRLEDMA